ncbi:MAG: hypothetical protein R3D29_12680 [Nitratireductor sp.]
MEGTRLASEDWSPWLAPFLNTVIPIGGAPFSVTTTPLKLIVTLAGLTAIAIGSAVLAYSRAGLVWRAVCQDERAAALVGIDARSVFVTSLTVAGLIAALAGVLAAWRIWQHGFRHRNRLFDQGPVSGLSGWIVITPGRRHGRAGHRYPQIDVGRLVPDHLARCCYIRYWSHCWLRHDAATVWNPTDRS